MIRPPFHKVLALVVGCTGAASAQQYPEWDAVRASYGNLLHLAGVGGDQDVNSWIALYEGADAVTVELSNPHMAASDAAGNVYIADKESHSILKVTPARTIHTVAGTHVAGFDGDGPATARQLDSPNGVFVLADGTFYIVDLVNLRLRRVGTDGEMTTIVEETSLLGGRALWVSPDEELIYYAGRDGDGLPSLKRWTPGGGIEVVSSGFSSMGNIAVDRDGAPIVTEDVGNRVFRIAPNGDKTVIAGNGSTSGGGDGSPAVDTGLNRVRGIACHPNGGFFLATQKGAHIWYVDTGGIIHKMLDCATTGNINAGNGALFSTPGIKMSEPRAITIAPNGDLIITTSDYGHVRVVECIARPAPPEVIEFDAGPAGLTSLRWRGVPWQSYLVEESSSLSSEGWTLVAITTSTVEEFTTVILPDPGVASRSFFRVRMPR